MKKAILILCLLGAFIMKAQESYFTVYNITVEPQNVSTISKLFDDYYSKNKPAGVSVSLYENHFNDAGNNYTHSVVFGGSLENLGNMYGGGGDNASWDLFLTRINQHIKDGFSSAMGVRLHTFGDTGQPHPFQHYILVDAENASKMAEAWAKMNGATNPADRLTMMGTVTVGQGPDGANVWVINAFKDFKSAMGGINTMMTPQQKQARDKAWDEFIANNGGGHVVRSGMRILMKTW